MSAGVVMSFRVAYLREVWRRMGAQFDGGAIAIYGAGRHTEFLLERVGDVAPTPRVAAIVDDDPRPGLREMRGVPVRRPGEVDPSTVRAVVVSSDSIEALLAERAQAWARSGGGAAPIVVRLYDGLPPGPYRGESDLPIAHATAPRGDRRADATAVTRIPRPAQVLELDDGLPLPPAELRQEYPAANAKYLAGGRAVAEAIRAALTAQGVNAAPGGELRGIMEWGCSTGRVLRHWAAHARAGAEVWGCDIDEPAAQWGAAHLAPTIRIFQNGLEPGFALPDGSLDLVYAISVLTHIADQHDAWLMELRRVLRPGGWLFVSINDEGVWERCGREPSFHIARLCPRLDFSRPLEDDFVNHGEGVHAQSFWHTRAVRARWSRLFDVVEITPWMIDGVQTGVLMRRPK